MPALVIACGATSSPSYAETPSATPAASTFCEGYVNQTDNHSTDYQLYCGEDSPATEGELFPEFTWCISQKIEPAPDCGDDSEVLWCQSVGEAAAKQHLEKRSVHMAACRAGYEQAFSKTGKDRAELIPAGYGLVEKTAAPEGSIAPLEHDFNGDGKADHVFVVGKTVTLPADAGQPVSTDVQQLRLMVALSQTDGTLKTIPVAPYLLSNSADEAGYTQTSLRVYEQNGLVLSTNTMDAAEWNRRDEYLFRFIDGQFKLVWESSGYTEGSTEEPNTPTGKLTVILDYAKGIALYSEGERCDTLGTPPCKAMKEEAIPDPERNKTLANFVGSASNALLPP